MPTEERLNKIQELLVQAKYIAEEDDNIFLAAIFCNTTRIPFDATAISDGYPEVIAAAILQAPEDTMWGNVCYYITSNVLTQQSAITDMLDNIDINLLN